jgi:hypothetical protein
MPFAALSALLAAALLVPGASGSAGQSRPQARSAALWTATFTAPTHRPRARERWPVKITAYTRHGRALHGTVQYHFIFGGKVVATRSCLDVGTTPCAFTGVYRDVVRWPARSVGVHLIFQSVVKTRLGTKKLNYWVTVVR